MAAKCPNDVPKSNPNSAHDATSTRSNVLDEFPTTEPKILINETSPVLLTNIGCWNIKKGLITREIELKNITYLLTALWTLLLLRYDA